MTAASFRRGRPLAPTPPPAPFGFATPAITREDVDAVVAVLSNGWLTTGSVCDALERELGEYLGVPHVVTVSSCTAALEIAFAHLGLGPGRRVGVPVWTFVSSGLAAVRHGATPVLLDVDADTLNLAPAALEAALSEGLDAVVAVHFGGVPVDRAVHELCAEAGVPLVEDAAHAIGATDHRGRVAGQGSVAACFSFYASKNITSAEGGALATENETVASFARAYRLHGLSSGTLERNGSGHDGYDCLLPGMKANLPDVLAALARSQLARFAESQARRRSLVERYRHRLAGIESVQVVPSSPAAGGADHLLVVLLPEGVPRKAVADELKVGGIPTSVHFPPLHHLSWFRENALIGPGGTPVADRLASRALSLPLHVGLRPDDVDLVCEALAAALLT